MHAAVDPEDVRTLLASETHAVFCVLQVLTGSHVSPSPVSMRPLPQPAQSPSLVGPHETLVGQKVSPGPHVRAVRLQTKVQAAALPEGATTVLASFKHAA